MFAFSKNLFLLIYYLFEVNEILFEPSKEWIKIDSEANKLSIGIGWNFISAK